MSIRKVGRSASVDVMIFALSTLGAGCTAGPQGSTSIGDPASGDHGAAQCFDGSAPISAAQAWCDAATECVVAFNHPCCGNEVPVHAIASAALCFGPEPACGNLCTPTFATDDGKTAPSEADIAVACNNHRCQTYVSSAIDP
jgi:hypothetical protein